MNKDNAAQYLPLVQALADGKVIQHYTGFKDSKFWVDCENVEFTSQPERFRIKPEPREWWVVEVLGSGGFVGRYAFEIEADASRFAKDLGGKLTHVREVTQ